MSGVPPCLPLSALALYHAPQNLSVELKLAGVNVFGNPSKKDSLILVLPDVRSSIAADAAAPLLRGMLCGRVYVKWPYLQEAEVGRDCGVGGGLWLLGVQKYTSPTQDTVPPIGNGIACVHHSTCSGTPAAGHAVWARVYVKWPYLQEADAGVFEVGVIGVRAPGGGGTWV